MSNRDECAAPRLRISYLIQQFPVPTETFAVSDIAALLAQRHDVTVYTVKLRRRREQALRKMCRVPEELSVHHPTIIGAARWPVIMWRRRKQAAWFFRQVVSHWRSAPGSVIQALLCIPRIFEIADRIDEDRSDVAHAFWSRHVGLVLPVLKMCGAPTLRTAFVGAYDLVADDFILGLTADAAEVLFSHAEVNRPLLQGKAASDALVEIIHRGIPLPTITDCQRDPFRIITASALISTKNVETVIRSFANARSRERRLKLEVFGDGPDRRLEEDLRELNCLESIIFHGHVPRDELFAQLQSASTFVLLSKKPSERLQMWSRETLWAGCAVISSRSDGIEELIPDASIGFVVDADDQSAVSAILTRLLKESDRQADRRRQRAPSIIKDHYSSDAEHAILRRGMAQGQGPWNDHAKKKSPPTPTRLQIFSELPQSGLDRMRPVKSVNPG